MKKFFAILFVIILLCIPFTVQAKQAFQFKEVKYENYFLSGETELKEGFVRATFFLPGNNYIVLFIPVKDGYFESHIVADPEQLILILTDEEYVLPSSEQILDICNVNI